MAQNFNSSINDRSVSTFCKIVVVDIQHQSEKQMLNLTESKSTDLDFRD